MYLRLHLPSVINMPGGSLFQQRRLQQVITQSFERAVTMLGVTHMQIEVVQAGPTGTSRSGISTANDGLVHHDRFPNVAVLRTGGSEHLYVGGSPYAETKNLAQAFQWGASLFGGNGYAVLQPKGASLTNHFYVVPLVPQALPVSGVAGETRILPLQDYVTVAIVDRDGQGYFRKQVDDPWNFALVEQMLARMPMDQSTINLPTTHGVTTYDRGMFEFIVMMDRSILAAIPWEKRAEYLLLLLQSWTSKQEEHAVLEIIYSTHSSAELEAIFALLREQGKYEQLFTDLDEQVYKLLQYIAEFVPDYPVDWHNLVTLLFDSQILSDVSLLTPPDPLPELLRTAHEMSEWLQSYNPGFGPRRANEIFNSVETLATFLWVVELARQGNLQAQKFVTQMITRAGIGSVQTLLGLNYAEELGTPYNQRERAASIGKNLRSQLESFLICDLLVWFTNINELHQTLQSLESFPQRLDALMSALNSLQRPGLDIPGVAPGTIKLLESCTSEIGGMTVQMAQGLEALLVHTSWDQATVLDLIQNIPSANLQAFLHTMTFVSPFYLEMWEVQTLQELALHPTALAFIREAGSDLMITVFKQVGNSWETFETFLERLAVKRMHIGSPIDYQWFLNRMRKGEETAFTLT